MEIEKMTGDLYAIIFWNIVHLEISNYLGTAVPNDNCYYPIMCVKVNWLKWSMANVADVVR